MLCTRTIVAGGTATLLGLAMCRLASGQQAPPSCPHQSAPYLADQESRQEQVRREKAMLKSDVEWNIHSADANIDALKRMASTDKGTDKRRDEVLLKQLSDLREPLTGDVDEIDKASIDNWSHVRRVIRDELNDMTKELRRVAAITKVEALPSGVANTQPR
jgi:hypothetical protein